MNIKSSGVTISAFTYRYDNVGNRKGVTESSGDRVTWTYDPANQLLSERRSGPNSYAVTYTYDGVGNRLTKNDSGARTTSVYDVADRLKYAQDGSGRTRNGRKGRKGATHDWNGVGMRHGRRVDWAPATRH